MLARFIFLTALCLFYAMPSFGTGTPVAKKSPLMNFVVVRGSYMNVHQGNGGDVSTGTVEIGYRHWFNSKVYGSFFGGAYPFESDNVSNTLGANISACVGLNIDNIMRLEYGIDYHAWGDAMPGTTGFLTKVSVPIRRWGLNEVFGGVSFPGNSSGKTPSYILQLGIGKLF